MIDDTFYDTAFEATFPFLFSLLLGKFVGKLDPSHLCKDIIYNVLFVHNRHTSYHLKLRQNYNVILYLTSNCTKSSASTISAPLLLLLSVHCIFKQSTNLQ